MKLTANIDKCELRAEGIARAIGISCDVRNEMNGRRALHEVVKSETAAFEPGVPYMPRRFPLGRWAVVAVLPKSDPYEAPYFISTDAWQMVEEWALDEAGRYSHAIGTVDDHGYGLHNSTSATTLGCIRILKRQDLLDLVAAIRDAWARSEAVTLDAIA